jgi:hypothetical protein
VAWARIWRRAGSHIQAVGAAGRLEKSNHAPPWCALLGGMHAGPRSLAKAVGISQSGPPHAAVRHPDQGSALPSQGRGGELGLTQVEGDHWRDGDDFVADIQARACTRWLPTQTPVRLIWVPRTSPAMGVRSSTIWRRGPSIGAGSSTSPTSNLPCASRTIAFCSGATTSNWVQGPSWPSRGECTFSLSGGGAFWVARPTA